MLEGATSSAVAKMFDMKAIRLLKHPVNGNTLILLNVGKWDTSVASFEVGVMSISFLLEELLLDPSFQIHGCQALWDLSEFGFSHIWQLSYSRVKLLLKVLLVRNL